MELANILEKKSNILILNPSGLIEDNIMKNHGCFQGTGDSLEKCIECTKCTVFF
jgi:hypothetical protein